MSVVSKKVRRTLWNRDKGCCFYCGKPLVWEKKTIDHVIPKSKGGPNNPWNLVISCKKCNMVKDDSDPTPEQLNLVLQRKILYEARTSIGMAIKFYKNCTDQQSRQKIKELGKLQHKITEMIKMDLLPDDFVLLFNNGGHNEGPRENPTHQGSRGCGTGYRSPTVWAFVSSVPEPVDRLQEGRGIRGPDGPEGP